jgi:hypothetical protein
MPYSFAGGRCLRQADILADVRAFELQRFEGDVPVGRVRRYEFAIVVSQDCDLEQDFSARFPGAQGVRTPDKLLFSIMLCGVYPEAAIKAGRHRDGAVHLSREEWKLVGQNKQPRYQYLGFVPQAARTLVADFKDYFFVPCEYLYNAIDQQQTRRISSMREPWHDHVLQRFAFYIMRVGLPKDFHLLEAPVDDDSGAPGKKAGE